MNIPSRRYLVIVTLALGSFARASRAETYLVTELGTFGAGSSYGRAINNRGEVVGRADNTAGWWHGFLWRGGELIDLGTVGGHASEAVAINSNGEIVGMSFNADGRARAFLWLNGVMINLGTLGGSQSYATSINDAGVVVGYSLIHADAEWHAFRWENNTMYDINPLGATSSYAYDINLSGQIAGAASYAPIGTAQRAVVWYSGGVTGLSGLSNGSSMALAINDAGEVLGGSEPPGPPPQAMRPVWWEQTFYTLRDLTLDGACGLPSGVSNRFEIVGRCGGTGAWRWEHAAAPAPTLIRNDELVPARDAAGREWRIEASELVAVSDRGDIVTTRVVHPPGLFRAVVLRKDRDQDGIPDAWETLGIDINVDGVPEVDLPAMGANPEHKDIFVEIDVMAGHTLQQSALDIVRDSFADAPNSLINNLDALDGITLHLVVDETIPQADWPAPSGELTWPPEFRDTKATHFGSPDDDPQVVDAKRLFYHYCIAADGRSAGSERNGKPGGPEGGRRLRPGSNRPIRGAERFLPVN